MAQFVALNIDKLTQYQQPYYLGTAKFDYDIDNGMEIEITAYNFASQHREVHFADGPNRPRTLQERKLTAIGFGGGGGGGSDSVDEGESDQEAEVE